MINPQVTLCRLTVGTKVVHIATDKPQTKIISQRLIHINNGLTVVKTAERLTKLHPPVAQVSRFRRDVHDSTGLRDAIKHG